jgi:hypothetical protein
MINVTSKPNIKDTQNGVNAKKYTSIKANKIHKKTFLFRKNLTNNNKYKI